MKAEEIRLGNYYSNNGSVCRVTPIIIQEVYESERSWCKPIQLTEEWLVKAGFEKEEEYEFGVLICYRYILETRKTNCVFTSNYSTEECIYVNYNQGGVDIEYVHQLQNLYFALTGTELTFNHQNQIK